MKKLFFAGVCILIFSEAHATSKSFFRPRSVTQDSTFEDALTYYDRYRVRRPTFAETNEYKKRKTEKTERYYAPSNYLNPRASDLEYLGIATEVDVTYESDSPIRQQSNLQSALSKKTKEKNTQGKTN